MLVVGCYVSIVIFFINLNEGSHNKLNRSTSDLDG